MMTKTNLEKFKKILETKKLELENSLKSFATKDPNLKGDWDSKYPEFSRDQNVNLEEEAGEVEEYINQLPVEHSYELRLRDINNALVKIKRGSYGKCEQCKGNIPQKRLSAYPEARFCLKCQK